LLRAIAARYFLLRTEQEMPKPLVSIVDDDPSVCEGLLDLLGSMGFGAEAFPRADEFLKSGRLDETACLIADVQMPGMSGFDLHDHLVRSGKAIPTILITAFPKDADRGRALRNGVNCYLAKPFNETDLLTCIKSGLKPRGKGLSP
jgi:FixJ family two-component response regulator